MIKMKPATACLCLQLEECIFQVAAPQGGSTCALSELLEPEMEWAHAH